MSAPLPAAYSEHNGYAHTINTITNGIEKHTVEAELWWSRTDVRHRR